MSAREEILLRIRAAQPEPRAIPEVPLFDRGAPAEKAFGENLARMGGEYVPAPGTTDIAAWIGKRFPEARIVCSATPEIAGNLPIERVVDPSDLQDVDVGVVRAGFGVAETGSVFVAEDHLRINALGFLAQHLVLLLDPGRIVPNLHHAYRDTAFRNARYAVLVTGPSATADIEGILIRGAQGIRSLTVIAAPPV